MNTQRENVRRVHDVVFKGGNGENVNPISSSQKPSQSSLGSSQGGGLNPSKKINLPTQLKPLNALNERRTILTDKSNKGGGGLSLSQKHNNTTLKQLQRQESITQVFVDDNVQLKKKVTTSTATINIKQEEKDTLLKPTLKDQELITTAEEFFSDNQDRYKEDVDDFVAIVPVLPIVVPKHLRHLYKKSSSNVSTTVEPTRKRSLSSLVQDENQDPNVAATYGEKKIKSSSSQAVHAVKKHIAPYAPALELEITKETQDFEKLQETKAKLAMLQTTVSLKEHQWNDPMMVAEYAGEIFGYLYDSEEDTMADPTYALNLQHEVTWKMRSVLVDWVIEIHYLFQLLPETLFLAVNIIDRFLSARTVVLGKLQLVGITSLFIATKFEEMSCPTMQDFLFMTDNAVKEDELIKAERFILQVLDFQLCYPNPMNFLRRLCTDELKCDVHTRTLAKYFMEISCIDHQFIGIRPSKIAAASLWLSKKMLAKGKWNSNYSKICGYAPDELKSTVESMLDYLSQPVTHDAFFKKWSSTKLSKASIFVRDWINRYYIN